MSKLSMFLNKYGKSYLVALLAALGVGVGVYEATPDAAVPVDAATSADQVEVVAPIGDEEISPIENAEPDQVVEDNPDAVDFASLKFCWGGFNGSRAGMNKRARIKSLKVTSSGLSYGWEAGGCEDLGAKNASDASCLACLFVADGRGGKFDWISTSRRTRDFKNIEGHYNGWDPAALKSSRRYYFVIISGNGKSRTNVIACDR